MSDDFMILQSICSILRLRLRLLYCIILSALDTFLAGIEDEDVWAQIYCYDCVRAFLVLVLI